MKKYKLSLNYEQIIDAKNEIEALGKFWKAVMVSAEVNHIEEIKVDNE